MMLWSYFLFFGLLILPTTATSGSFRKRLSNMLRKEKPIILPSVEIRLFDYPNHVVRSYNPTTLADSFQNKPDKSVDLAVLHLFSNDEGRNGIAVMAFRDIMKKIKSVNEIIVDGVIGYQFIEDLHKIAAAGTVTLSYINYIAHIVRVSPFPCNSFAKMQLNILDSDLRGMDFSHCTQMKTVEISSFESTVTNHDPLKILNSLFKSGSESVTELHIIYRQTVLLLITNRLHEIGKIFPKLGVLSTSVAAGDARFPGKKAQIIKAIGNIQQSLYGVEFWYVDAMEIDGSDVMCPENWHGRTSTARAFLKPIGAPGAPIVRCTQNSKHGTPRKKMATVLRKSKPSLIIQVYDCENYVVKSENPATLADSIHGEADKSVKLELLHLFTNGLGTDGIEAKDIKKELSNFSNLIRKIKSVSKIRVEGQIGYKFIDALHKIAAEGDVNLTYQNFVAHTPRPTPFPCNSFAKMQLNILDSDLRGMDFSHCTQLQIVDVTSFGKTVAEDDPLNMLSSLFEGGSNSVTELRIIYRETVLLQIANRLHEIRKIFPKLDVLSTSVAANSASASRKNSKIKRIIEKQQSLSISCVKFWFVDTKTINDSICPKYWDMSLSPAKAFPDMQDVPILTCTQDFKESLAAIVR